MNTVEQIASCSPPCCRSSSASPAAPASKPWDRDVLARPDMQIVSDPIEAAADEHIYFSKEASSGGQGFGGGGCGCN